MKKRVISILVVLAMLISSFASIAVNVFAEDTYKKVTLADEITTGKYVLVTDGYAMGAFDGSWLGATALTAEDSVTAPDATLVWTVTKNDDGTVKLTDANGVTVAPKGGNTNGIIAGDYSWTLTFADGTATFAGIDPDTVTLAANVGSGHKFRAYKNTTAAGYPHQFTMYKLEEAAPAPAPAEPTNLALNKPLEGINPLNIEGDCRNGNLTDGKHPEPGKGWSIYGNEPAAADYMIISKGKNTDANGVAEGVVDLGAHCEISEVKVYIGTSNSNSIYAPNITVSLSTDGKTYTEFGKYASDTSKDTWDFVTISGEKTTARYAKVTFTLNGSYALVAEVEVYGVVAAEQPEPEPTPENLALGLDGGVKGHAQYTADLTDGNAHNQLTYGGEWFAFYNNGDANATNAPGKVGTLLYDLGELCLVDKVRINMFIGNSSAGIHAPESVAIEYSADGEKYSTFTSRTFDDPAVGDSTIEFLEFAGEASVKARYVKITIKIRPSFAFLNEVEIIGVKGAEPDPDEPASNEKLFNQPEIVIVDGKLNEVTWANTKMTTLPMENDMSVTFGVRADAENVYVALKAARNWADIPADKAWTIEDNAFDASVMLGSRLRLWVGGENNTVAGYFDIVRQDGTVKAFFKKNATTNITAAIDGDTIEVKLPKTGDVTIGDTFKLNVNYSDNCFGEDGTTYGQVHSSSDPGNAWKESTNYPAYTLADITLGKAVSKDVIISDLGLEYVGEQLDHVISLMATTEATTIGQLTAKTVGSAKDLNFYYVLIFGKDDGKIISTHCAIGRNALEDGSTPGVKTDVPVPANSYVLAIRAQEKTWVPDEETIKSIKVGDVVTLTGVTKTFEEIAALTDNVPADGATFSVTESTEEPTPVPEGVTVRVSHVNYYSWEAYNGMIVNEVGKNAATIETIKKDCKDNWRAIKVDNVDGKLTVTSIQEKGIEKTDVVSEGGFILYVCTKDADYANALAVNIGAVVTADFDWKAIAHSETPVGTLTFANAEIQQDPDAIVKLDGALTDEEWKDADTVSTGLWQNVGETDPKPAINAQYSVRADDKYVYVALKVDKPWEYKDTSYQTGSTFFRIWFLGDANYAEENKRQFFDVAYNSKGDLNYFLAKIATDKIVAAADTTAETIAVEFRFEKATVNADKALKMMVTYSSPYVTDGEIVKYNAYHLTQKEAFADKWSTNASMYTEHKLVEDETPVDPDPENYTVRVSHVNKYSWGAYNAMIITGEGKNSESVVGYKCEYWRAIKVDKVDGNYVVTAIEESSAAAKTLTASADGYIVYVFSKDADYNNALAVKVGHYVTADFDWTKNASSETPVGTLTFTNVKPVDPLPEGAIVLSHAGYPHGDATAAIIMAGDGKTVAELTALGRPDKGAKDLAFWTVLVVDENNTVIAVHPSGSGTNKLDVVCPTGGYLLAAWDNDATRAAYDAINKVKVGDIITLYGVDPAAVRELSGNVALENAGFTYESPVVVTKSPADLDKIIKNPGTGTTDGWDNKVLIQNPTPANVPMQAELIREVPDGKLDTVTLSLYYNASVMIGYPEGDAIVLTSLDGTNYDVVGTFDLTPADLGTPGNFSAPANVTTVMTFEQREAKYVMVVLNYGRSTDVLGENPGGVGKIFWEFGCVSQFDVSYTPVDPDAELVGPENENANFNLTVTAPETYLAGGTVKVTIGIKDVKVPMCLFEFNLCYDKTKVEPIVKNDGDINNEMLSFLTKHPENWNDSVCVLDEENGCYALAFMNVEGKNEVIKDGEIEITVEFRVKDDADGDLKFWIPTATVKGGCGAEVEQVVGNGDITTLTRGEAQLGDVNLDGKVDEIDYLLLKRQVLGIIHLEETNPMSYKQCFINGDEEVNDVDYLLLKRLVLKVITAEQIKNS